MKSALMAFWADRNPREQKLLQLLALLLLLGAGFLLLWLPAKDHGAALEKELTSLRAQRAQMQSMVHELDSANSITTKAMPPSADLGSSLKQSLAESGLSARRLEAADAGKWQVEVADAPFSSLADWLSRIRSQWKVTLVEGSFDRNATPGNVHARLVLQGEGH